MAFYIPISLVENTDTYVIYEYTQPIHGSDPAHPKRQRLIGQNEGRAQLDKSTGKVTQIHGKDWDARNVVFHRVARVMIRCHQSGLFPEVTAYEA